MASRARFGLQNTFQKDKEVKRALRQFGYPPDMQLLATETALKQAEMIAGELASGQ